MKLKQSGMELAEVIRKAISDCEITATEYEEILKVANADQHIDSQERQLLSQLQQLIANGTITRVRG
jgi:hypothetical protein